jgi:hypothetical protein
MKSASAFCNVVPIADRSLIMRTEIDKPAIPPLSKSLPVPSHVRSVIVSICLPVRLATGEVFDGCYLEERCLSDVSRADALRMAIYPSSVPSFSSHLFLDPSFPYLPDHHATSRIPCSPRSQAFHQRSPCALSHPQIEA